MSFTIAIDGPAAAGKGTISKAVAAHFGVGHLDTGLLYRAVGKRMLDGVEPIEAALALVAEDLEAEGLRTADVAQAASKVAAIPEVRSALVDFQRAYARRAGGAVLDGRALVPRQPGRLGLLGFLFDLVQRGAGRLRKAYARSVAIGRT